MGSFRVQDDKLLWPPWWEACPVSPQPRARFAGRSAHVSQPGQGRAAQVDRTPPAMTSWPLRPLKSGREMAIPGLMPGAGAGVRPIV